MTQAEVAEAVCDEIERATGRRPSITGQAIYRLEAGELTWPRNATRAALMAVLGSSSAADLGLYPKRTRRDVEREEATKRRQFGLTGLVVPIAAMDAPGRAGSVDLEEMRARFTRLQELDSFLGGGDTFRLYAAELAKTELTLARSSCSAAVRTALTGLAGEQAQQAGWAAFDAGFASQALDLYEYSHRAAQEAGCPELAANALIQIAYAIGSSGAIAAADAACSTVGTAAPAKARAMLESRRAWSLATTGDRDGAARALDASYEALEDSDRQPAARWFDWVNRAELDIMTGRVWSVLHAPEKATPPLTRALADYPDHWSRDKSLYMTWLADAHLDAGNVDEAMQITGRAFDLAVQVASVRPLTRVRQVSARCVSAGIAGAATLHRRVVGARVPIPQRL
ncbi:tetratricopeptide repeat protein [Nocardia goodfellowii]|uniref:Tetratricopeptide (TPR) repeat protein n=1 Tax=Nocardia goodfellowii TaxID=882446 RepID=A0ABS4Q9X2_9NOCA|nr:hypothetical protein [Nocardia goodfellowii]MBP2188494.1 tetratricopeptide (TPR) repeat protein [Nocardia goodfellowii]